MKKIVSLAFAALSILAIAAPTQQAQAQTPFFLDKQGAEAEYVLKDAKGKPVSYVRSVVTELNATDADNFTVTYTAETFDKNHKALTAPISMTVRIKDGTVEMTPMTGMEGVTFEGTLPTYPSNLSVGQEFEYSYSMDLAGMKTTSTGKDTVVARESLTTEAGAFDCFKVESDVTAKVMFMNTRMKVVNWLSAGVGTVKSEIYDKNGKLQTVQELISLKK